MEQHPPHAKMDKRTADEARLVFHTSQPSGEAPACVYVKKEKMYDHRVKEARELMTMAEIRSEMGYIIEDLNQDDRQWAGPITAPKEDK